MLELYKGQNVELMPDTKNHHLSHVVHSMRRRSLGCLR